MSTSTRPVSTAIDHRSLWETVRLSTLLTDIQPGFACGAHSRGGDGIPHLRPMNVSTDGQITLDDLKLVPQAAADEAGKWIECGDVLFNNTNSPELVGKTAYYNLPELRAFSNHMTRLRVNRERLDPRYCAVWLHQLWRDGEFARRCNNHVSQASISREVLRELEIPLPPLAEQNRIVEALERLTARVDAARARLATVPAILKRFRQSVLAAACSGRLTEDWRNDNPEIEPAHAGLKLFDYSRKQPKGKTTKPEAGELDVESMPDLPVTWVYRRADTVVASDTIITYGIVLPGPEVPGGVPYVRQQDIQDGGILVEQLRRTTPDIAAKHSRSVLAEGDVLLCIIRHLRVATVPRGLDGANLTQGAVRMRPSEVMSGPYLARFLASQHAQAWMKQRHFGMSMPRINVEHARAIPIAVPPMAEQAEIVRRVESLMKLADAIERRVAPSQARADKLTQSILAKAFRGELASPDPDRAAERSRSALGVEMTNCERAAASDTFSASDRVNGRKVASTGDRRGRAPRSRAR
ncbi:MAG: hypothetical protein AMXMBFR58_00160 [Phycisphaerae bacterium]